MTDAAPAILTPDEALILLAFHLNPPSALPCADARSSRLYQRVRRQQASHDLYDLYGETLEPDALMLVEATAHWALTRYGLLSLEDTADVIRSEDLFDRQLLARMGRSVGVHRLPGVRPGI